jgi:hypothetical protein
MSRLRSWVVAAVVPAQLLFVAGWLAAAAVQDRYSTSRDDISDLTAETAQHAWVLLAPETVAGVVTIAFAVLVLRPALDRPGQRAVAPWLVVASLMGLDNVSDLFFRLDCGLSDPGCSLEDRGASWHGQVHEGVGLFCALATVAAMFALARRFGQLDGWADLAVPARVYAVGFVVVLAAYAAREGRAGAGFLQRALVLVIIGGFAVLVRRTARVDSPA